MRGHLRKLARTLAVGTMAVIAIGAPRAPAETRLPNRPTEPAAQERIDTLRALADQVGWGSLRQTEHMKLADTAYGGPPILAVTAAPYLPVTFFLESRHWAVQRLLGVEEADARFGEIYVDPSEGLKVDLLVVAETPAALRGTTPVVRYSDDTGRALSAVPVELDVTEEPALGGALFAGRATVLVPFPENFDWAEVRRFSLAFEAGDIDRVLEWTFAD